jgi:hypothetical protein
MANEPHQPPSRPPGRLGTLRLLITSLRFQPMANEGQQAQTVRVGDLARCDSPTIGH